MHTTDCECCVDVHHIVHDALEFVYNNDARCACLYPILLVSCVFHALHSTEMCSNERENVRSIENEIDWPAGRLVRSVRANWFSVTRLLLYRITKDPIAYERT